MYDSQASDLPPCELSSHCSRLLDDLVDEGNEEGITQEYVARDRQRLRLVLQMRAHLPHCPTCTAALHRAQALRSGQRIALRGYLQQAETAVPPATSRIIQALHEEEQAQTADAPLRKRMQYRLPELNNPPSTDFYHDYFGGDLPSNRTTDPLLLSLSPARRWLRNGLTFATIVALIFTAVGVFSHYLARSVTTLSGLQTQVAKDNPGFSTKALASPVTRVPATPAMPLTPSPTPDAFQGWDGLVVISTVGAMYSVITTYNYQNGDSRQLAVSSANMQFDGVGSEGQNMLYQVTTDGQTQFYTLNRLSPDGYFYAGDQDDVLNAIWMPDNQHVLIATLDSGVIMVDSQTGQSQSFLPTLKTSGLKFYRGDYLYFLGGSDRVLNALYRINVNTGIVQRVAGRMPGGDFWLSPDGLTVFYRYAGPIFKTGIYAVASDGSNSQVLRANGLPIGYAADDSLVIMRQVGHAFEVIQLGATPAQDRVLLNDAAPGAISLCPSAVVVTVICDTSNVALSPLSHALVVVGSYSDGSHKVWSDDLTSGKQFVLMQPDNDTTVSVPGWDRIAVP